MRVRALMNRGLKLIADLLRYLGQNYQVRGGRCPRLVRSSWKRVDCSGT